MPRPPAALLAALALLAAGCASAPLNPPLPRVDVASGYRFMPPPGPGNTESLFVVLSFSGGGTRAAAFSYGAMQKLRETTIEVGGERRRLLDEVDMISSISGGSFTAAYYGLFGERLFDDFDVRFLKRKIQRGLFLRFLAPWNWPRLWSRSYDRIDLAADFYDRTVFDGRTFAALVERNRAPLIVLNATDASRVTRFEFTQDQFDLICSDLGPYPVARAVAASSAFPGLLSPLTLKAYPRACGYREPVWLDNARLERQRGSRRFYNAQTVDAYLDPETGWVHLLDGGLADNIGLRGPLQMLFSSDNPRSAPDEVGDRSVLQKINLGKIDTVLVIAVNARTRSRSHLGGRRQAPNLLGAFNIAANGPMGNYSYETIELLRESMRRWTTDVQQEEDCRDRFAEHCRQGELPEEFLQKVAYFPVELTFDSIDDEATRERLQEMPTSFQLAPEQVDELAATAGQLLEASPEFQRFLRAHAPR